MQAFTKFHWQAVEVLILNSTAVQAVYVQKML